MLARAPNPAGRWPVIVGWAFAAAFAGRPTGDSPAKGNRQREGEKEVTCAVEGSSSSWLNLAERWFREITDKRIRCGVFRSVKELVPAITEDIEKHNEDPQVFVVNGQRRGDVLKSLASAGRSR